MPLHLPASLKGISNDAAIAHLAKYYSKTQPYVGATFDTWQSSQCSQSHDMFTADDILSVNFLSVAVPSTATKTILVTEPNKFNSLLALIPVDQPLWDAGPPHPNSPQWEMERELLALHGIGLTIASKLMARKRPHLVPISDSVVRLSLGLNKLFWKPLYDTFSDVDVRERLQLISDEVARREDVALPVGLSLLRIFDVIAWMDGKMAGAKRERAESWADEPLTSE